MSDLLAQHAETVAAIEANPHLTVEQRREVTKLLAGVVRRAMVEDK